MPKTVYSRPDILDAPPAADADAERAVLGSILIAPSPNETYDHVAEILTPRDFSDEAHRIIYEQFARLRRDGSPIDARLVGSSLANSRAHDVRALDAVGGVDYVATVIGSVGSPFHSQHYAMLVAESARKRRLYDLAIQTVQASHNGKPSTEILDEMRGSLDEIDGRNTVTKYRQYTAAELDDAEIDVEYIVDGVLAANHVGGIIGASKSLKTTIAADLAFSVATSGHFLGYLPVLRSARTAFMCGESGLPTLQETLRRIARAAGRQLRDAEDNLIISDELPQLGSTEHMTALRRFIEHDELRRAAKDILTKAQSVAGFTGCGAKLAYPLQCDRSDL